MKLYCQRCLSDSYADDFFFYCKTNKTKSTSMKNKGNLSPVFADWSIILCTEELEQKLSFDLSTVKMSILASLLVEDTLATSACLFSSKTTVSHNRTLRNSLTLHCYFGQNLEATFFKKH